MELSRDLLDQARQLLNLEPHKPKQSSLRRAVSTAYYATFHLLSEESARRVSPKSPPNLALHLQRAFDHSAMRQVCTAIAQPSSRLNSVFSLRPSSELLTVARNFELLQDARYEADYDPISRLRRIEAETYVRMAERAFLAWHRVRSSDEANVFLVALLMKKEWPRR